MIIKFLILTSITFNIYAQGLYYYQNGKKVDLYPSASTRSTNTLMFFQDKNGFSLGVGQKILIGLKNKLDANAITKRFNLKNVRTITPTLLSAQTKSYEQSINLSASIVESELVKFAHPDFVKTYKKRYLSGDPLVKFSHHLNSISGVKDAHIHLGGAWSVSRGKGIKLGIYDDAIEVSHEDLAGAVVSQYDAGNKDFNAEPDLFNQSHGTIVTGLAGARENGKGSVGVAPESSLYIVKFGGRDQSDLATIEGFNWFKSHNVDVINNSWGTFNVSDAVKDSIDDLATNARGGKGIILVFAQGNDSCNDTVSCNGFSLSNDESALDSVIAVGASNQFNQRSDYSNYGIYLDLVAPGGDGDEVSFSDVQSMVSIDRTDRAGYSSDLNNLNYVVGNINVIGTSFAAPLVSATAALVLAANPELTRVEVQTILQNSADKVGGYTYTDGRSYEMGYGKINATRAVAQALREKTVTTTLTLQNGWNLISLPVVATLSNRQFFAPQEGEYNFDVLGSYSSIYTYTNDNYELNPAQIKEAQGFWINSQENSKNITFTGKSYIPDIDALSSGWHLLGTANTLTNPKIFYEANSIWIYKDSGWTQNPKSIDSGEGFWISLN